MKKKFETLHLIKLDPGPENGFIAKIQIPNQLEALQSQVQGYIEVYSGKELGLPKDHVIIFNEEGLFEHWPAWLINGFFFVGPILIASEIDGPDGKEFADAKFSPEELENLQNLIKFISADKAKAERDRILAKPVGFQVIS